MPIIISIVAALTKSVKNYSKVLLILYVMALTIFVTSMVIATK
jgi:hypothetical protein